MSSFVNILHTESDLKKHYAYKKSVLGHQYCENQIVDYHALLDR